MMLDQTRLQALIRDGENSFVEFKVTLYKRTSTT